MIKSNWFIKNQIMFLSLIFMQIYPIIIFFDLESALSLQSSVQYSTIKFLISIKTPTWFLYKFNLFLSNLQSSCYYYLFFIFYFKRKGVNSGGNNPKIGYDKVTLVEINPTTSKETTIKGCTSLHALPQPRSLVVGTCITFTK
jgi:hypothetical protein